MRRQHILPTPIALSNIRCYPCVNLSLTGGRVGPPFTRPPGRHESARTSRPRRAPRSLGGRIHGVRGNTGPCELAS
jgi:hypothetical protein